MNLDRAFSPYVISMLQDKEIVYSTYLSLQYIQTMMAHRCDDYGDLFWHICHDSGEIFPVTLAWKLGAMLGLSIVKIKAS